MCVHSVVSFINPPENITVCRGSDVVVHYGYMWSTLLPVTWIINGTSFTQQEIVDSPLYQLNNARIHSTISLTVFAINHTTTFQCIVHSTPNTTSRFGAVTVTTGMYICMHMNMYTPVAIQASIHTCVCI